MAFPLEEQERVVPMDDGARLAVSVVEPATGGNDGPTVVLAHCWTGSRAVWASVARRLARAGTRVVLYDQRGHGASTTGSAAPAPARLGRDLAALLEELDLQEVVLAGHSMGGFTVLALVNGHLALVQSRVRGLVLVSTAAHGLNGPAEARLGRLIGSDRLTRAMARPRSGLWLVRGALGKRPRRADVELTRDLFVATDPRVRLACFAEFGTMDLREGLGKVEVPTVVMTGSRDRLTRPKLGRAIAALVPDARFELLAGAGHMLPLEAPERVADEIYGLVVNSARSST